MVLFSPDVGKAHWWAANVVDAGGRWAVPIFIMLSGALLLNPSREESAGGFYRRRLARLGVATAFWSAFFMGFSVYYTHWCVTAWNVPQGDWHRSVWRDLLKGQPYMHLHFVFRLAGLYLLTPLLRVYVRHASWRLRAWMMLAILALAMANSVATCFLGTEPSGFAILWPFLGFYLAGDVLREVSATGRRAAWGAAGLLLSTAAIALGTGAMIGPLTPGHMQPAAYPAIDMMMYDFLNPARVLSAFSAWFLLAWGFGRIPARAASQRAMHWLAPLTLGIYLVHPLFREVLWKDGYRLAGGAIPEWVPKDGYLFRTPSWWLGMPLMMLAVAAGSTLLTFLLRQVPGVRKITG
jgi:surface polysaccharide O-acyltransferase-like enzyme